MTSPIVAISKYSMIGKHLSITRHLSVCVSFVVILVFFLNEPGAARGAESANEDSPSEAGLAPMGAIESIGVIRINGRIARSGEALWGNELLEAPAIESAQVILNERGMITLGGGSALRLAAVVRDGDGASTLFAYLMAGSMTIKLTHRAGARICASDSIFAVSPGSSARLIVSEGHGRLLSSKGEVKGDSDWRFFRAAYVAHQAGAQMTPGEYKIAPYNFTFGLGGYADIEARSVRYLQFRVTDKDDRPAPDLLLLILLKNNGDSSSAGSINYGATMMRVMTDHNGVAVARFDAGVTIGASAALEVTIVKNSQTLKGNIRIIKPKGFWTLKKALPVMTTAAVAVAVSAVAARSYGGELPTISTPPVEEPVIPDEPVVSDEPDRKSRKRRPPKEGEPECFFHYPPIRGPRKRSEPPHDRRRRRDYPERSHSEKRGDHWKFRGEPGRNSPHPQEPKSRRGGGRMFRGKFGITFSVTP
jgi:hypothetical protein